MAAAAVSIVGAGSMVVLGANDKEGTANEVAIGQQQDEEPVGPILSAKNTLRSGIFWKIGIAHSVGYLVRASDILLGPFTSTISSLPGKFLSAAAESLFACRSCLPVLTFIRRVFLCRSFCLCRPLILCGTRFRPWHVQGQQIQRLDERG